jgi:hypothetical protein
MKRVAPGIILAGLFLAFWLFHSPIADKLTKDEIKQYLATIENNAMPPDEKAEILTRLRKWAEADDGKPVFMLNLMRNYSQVRHYPGAPEFKGSPEESNKFYESISIPLLFKRFGYPMFLGTTQGKNIIGMEPALNDWSEVIVVRYRNRRAFLSLLADPVYGPVMPYKLMAVRLYLTPLSGSLVIPDLRWVVGAAALVIFLAAGWIRAARKKPGSK